MKQDREFLLHFARVMLREARARKHKLPFAAFLLNGAICATREARLPTTTQGDLFV